ncbi:calcineurin-like phosphoesterase family protein [Flavobacterium agricola]|uniref:Calcineurin-like phosphoesterase family protein n=1 Tax=Flavobacterium agricola TaxID=2870839 RepID=A0ABY6LZV7_9FLAO|nr:calcineurin-like phosphoesterase family protein [Flavobacterium agricola]UYW01005.1 calcineurin-like phosphoesterase family protein [Flavobacterium agricola]
MNIKTLLLATMLGSVSMTFAQHKVSGTVYADLNKNGKKDGKEKGIANVQISNGTEVVSTDKNGNYSIFVPEDATLFVIKPSGYQIPLDQYNLPKFYYTNKPNGSPKLKYGGVKPTGKLPKKINFGLYPAEESEQFTSFVFGDPQTYTQEEVQFFIDGIIKDVDANQAIFGISLGDLVGDDLVLHPEYKKAIQQINLPWYNVIGNHDMDYDATIDEHSDETYEANFGPANYSFNYGKVHFIVLDDILYPDPRDGKGYWAGFREDQFQFIENDLKFVPKDNLVVLAFHIPLMDNDSEWFRVEDRNRLFELLKDFPNTVSLSAHTHIQQQLFYDKEQGWKQDKPHHEYNVGTTSGDWYSGLTNKQGVPASTMRDGTPKGYALMHFDGNQYKVDYKVAGENPEYQINIFTPKTAEFSNPRNRHFIYANFFMGKKGDDVQYRIDNGEWKNMTFVEEPDPAYLSQYYQWDLATNGIKERRPSQAMLSSHLWRTNIPKNLSAGKHTVEVKATDMYGKTTISKAQFQVAK